MTSKTNLTETAESQRPVMIYDEECGFCRYWIEIFQQRAGEAVWFTSHQESSYLYPSIPPEAFGRAVHLIEPPDGAAGVSEADGGASRVSRGAEAVLRLYAHTERRWPLWCYLNLPGARGVCEGGYRFSAGHRSFLMSMTRLMWGRTPRVATWHVSRWVFLRLLAVIYFIAFLSLLTQLSGLIGHNGLLPAENFIEAVRHAHGAMAWWHAPTLGLIDASDRFLKGLCVAGLVASLLVFARLLPGPSLLALWVLYQSVFQVGQTFLGFQWDLLLLEMGLLAVFLAPWRLMPRLKSEPPPSAPVLWLHRWLLFRLMFSSGMVKLASRDDAWWDLSALTVHYFTQPLPTWTAWLLHQLPRWFHVASCGAMFVIELAVPFLVFLPRRPRHVAAVLLILLQVLILLSGNYTFFNWLTIALCLLLLEDAALLRLLPRRMGRKMSPRVSQRARRRPFLLGRIVFAPFMVLVLLVGCFHLVRLFDRQPPLPDWVFRVVQWTRTMNPVNHYGLFADMTVTRPEIIVEGSNNGRTWRAYEFKWKPGRLDRRPRFVAPHQPRLDWQMWFAALSKRRARHWFTPFMQRLLEGSPEVLALLAHNPFPDRPPRFVRAVLYDYKFTDWAALRREGRWWRRERRGLYFPAIRLKNQDE